MKFIGCITLLALLCAAPAIASRAPAPSPPGSIVEVGGSESNGRRVATSGVIVENSRGLTIATGAAALRGLAGISVQTQASETLTVLTVHFISGYDLAIVRTSTPAGTYTPARLAKTSTNGQAAEVWGFSKRFMAATIIGTAVRFEPTQFSRLGLVCELCDLTDAGSGIFTKDGALVGIIAARWDYGDKAGRLSLMEGEPLAALSEITALK